MAITAPVRLHIGSSRVDLGNVTVCSETLPDPDETRIRIGPVVAPELLGDQVATLLEHAARQLRKGALDAAPRTG